MRPTPAAAAMPATLVSGSRARQSVAASRIAATLRRASARRALGAVPRASLEGIPKSPFLNTGVRVTVGVVTRTCQFMLAPRAGQGNRDQHATPRPQAQIPRAGTDCHQFSRGACSAPARHAVLWSVALGGPGPAGGRAADARPGRHGGERRAAGHRRGPAPASQRTAVGDDDLHLVLRRADAARRTDRRPVRRAAPDPDRPGPVHRIVAAVRAVARRRGAAGRAVVAGSALGVILGGVLTSEAGWRWVFAINVPIGVALLIAIPLAAPARQEPGAVERGLDIPAAVLVTAGTGAAIYGLINVGSHSWAAASTVLPLVLAAATWTTFAVLERL